MRRALALALALLAGNASAAGVDAAEHDAFWLWSGVAAQPVLAQARTLYVLQGQVSAPRQRDGQARLIAQGIAIPRLKQGEVWVVYRAHTLRWNEEIGRAHV